MSDLFNISLIKGEPFTRTVTASLCTSGYLNLSGFAVTGGIRYLYTEPNLVDFDIIVNSEVSGILTINLTSGQTNSLPVSDCIYYIKAYPSGGGTFVDLLNGYAQVYPL
jgi:hypothetical protein